MTIDEYNKSKNKKSNNKYFKNFTVRFMICTIMLFIILIISKQNTKFKDFIKNKLFSEEFNFSIFNKYYNKYVVNPISKLTDDIMVFNIDNNSNNIEVIEEDDKVKIKTNTNEVKVVQSGIVVYIGVKEDSGNTVIIQQSDGTDCTYSNLDNINVNMYSYQTKDSILGTYSDYYYLYFEKDKKSVNYKDYIEKYLY